MSILSQVLNEDKKGTAPEVTDIDLGVLNLVESSHALTTAVDTVNILDTVETENSAVALALTENLLSIAAAMTDVDSTTSIATESDASQVTATIATESIKEVSKRIMEVINNIISKMLSILSKINAWLNNEIPKMRNTLVKIQERARNKAGAEQKDKDTYINTYANFFQTDGKKVKGRQLEQMPERYAKLAGDVLLQWSGNSVNALEMYTQLLDNLTESVEEKDLLRLALEMGVSLNNIVDKAGFGVLESDQNNDKRWIGFDYQRFLALDDQAIFVLRPNVPKGKLFEQLRTLSKARVMFARASTKREPLEIETMKLKTLDLNVIVDGCTSLIDILDDITNYQAHSKTKKIESTVKQARKAAERFNKETLGNENTNSLLLRHRSDLTNGITAPINMATVFPAQLIKHLLKATKAYTYVYGQMLKNY